MRLELMNAVVLAEDYAALRDWYIYALGLELRQEWTEKFHYAELVKNGKLVVGIADAKEMGLTPHPHGEKKNATVVAQFNVDDVPTFLANIREKGGHVPFGPSYDPNLDLHFGGFADIEGNPAWVVQMPKLLAD
jgi:predicted enzyme related to lactoylglutathione lyase